MLIPDCMFISERLQDDWLDDEKKINLTGNEQRSLPVKNKQDRINYMD